MLAESRLLSVRPTVPGDGAVPALIAATLIRDTVPTRCTGAASVMTIMRGSTTSATPTDTAIAVEILRLEPVAIHVPSCVPLPRQDVLPRQSA